MNLDSQCLDTLQRAPGASVAWYLMASWLYYHRGAAILSDPFFDWLGQTMAGNWESIEHRHKHLIHPSDLAAGTLYRLRPEDYPTITRDTAEGLARQIGAL